MLITYRNIECCTIWTPGGRPNELARDMPVNKLCNNVSLVPRSYPIDGSRGSRKRKNRPGVEKKFKATRARPTYLCNQAHFHIWKCDIRGIRHARQPWRVVPAAMSTLSPPQMRVSPPHHDHQTPPKRAFMLVFGVSNFSGSHGHGMSVLHPFSNKVCFLSQCVSYVH